MVTRRMRKRSKIFQKAMKIIQSGPKTIQKQFENNACNKMILELILALEEP